MSGWTRRRMFGSLLLGVAALYSVGHFAYSAGYAAVKILGGDFLTAFPGPLAFQVTQQWPWLAKEWIGPARSWNYGPLIQFITLPLVFAETRMQAMQVALFVDYALVAATFGLWVRLVFGARARLAAWVGLACIWLNYFPLLEAVAGREIELLELFLVSAAIWALRRNRQGLAGSAIGLAVMTKFLPIIFLPYLLLKRFYRAFWIAVGVVVAMMGVTALSLGFDGSNTWGVLRDDLTGVQAYVAYANQALVNILDKMFTVFNINVPHPLRLYGPQVHAVGFTLQGVVLAACGAFLWRWRRSRLLEIECALLAVVMVMVAPHANTYYLVFVLPAISIGLASWLRDPSTLGSWSKAAYVSAVVMSGFLVPMQVFQLVTGLPGVVVARVLQLYSLPAFGAIFSALVMVELHRNLRTESPPVVVQAAVAQEMAV